MKAAALLGAVLTLSSAEVASSQSDSEGAQPLACVSSRETRDLYLAKKLAQPFRVMREAAAAGQGEAINIELCRFAGSLVYDVTLLSRDGRVSHRLMNAMTGAALPGRGTP